MEAGVNNRPIFNLAYATRTCTGGIVSAICESHIGAWVNNKTGSMMGLSIHKHLPDWKGKDGAE